MKAKQPDGFSILEMFLIDRFIAPSEAHQNFRGGLLQVSISVLGMEGQPHSMGTGSCCWSRAASVQICWHFLVAQRCPRAPFVCDNPGNVTYYVNDVVMRINFKVLVPAKGP